MSIAEIIAFFFRIINVCAFYGLLLYVFRRKIRDQIKTKIKEKEVFWQNLQTNKQALIDQQHKLGVEKAWQEKHGNELLQKITIWADKVGIQQRGILDFQTHNAKMISERTRLFHEKSQKQNLLKQVVPRAVGEARCDLKQHFEQEKNAVAYMDKLFGRLKEPQEGSFL